MSRRKVDREHAARLEGKDREIRQLGVELERAKNKAHDTRVDNIHKAQMLLHRDAQLGRLGRELTAETERADQLAGGIPGFHRLSNPDQTWVLSEIQRRLYCAPPPPVDFADAADKAIGKPA